MIRRMGAFVRIGVVLVLVLAGSGEARADRMSLWNILTFKCLRHLAKSEAPIPCDFVDVSEGEDRGVAYLKDAVGVGRMLAIPTRRISGIEDASLLEAEAPNYFAAAWTARARLERRLRKELPREAVAIAVDSSVARGQDQLSLAIDCVDVDVAAALREHLGEIDDDWRPIGLDLKGRRYWARRLDSPDLASASPFRLLADGLPEANRDMGSWSLAAIGATFDDKPGFVLLASSSIVGGGRASELQDRDCVIATRTP